MSPSPSTDCRTLAVTSFLGALPAARRTVRQALSQAGSAQVHVPFQARPAGTSAAVSERAAGAGEQLVLPDAARRSLTLADAALPIALVEAHGPVAVGDQVVAEHVHEVLTRGAVVRVAIGALDVVGAASRVARQEKVRVVDAGVTLGRRSDEPAERAVSGQLRLGWQNL